MIKEAAKPPLLFRSRPCYETTCHGLSVSYPTHNKGKMRGPGRFRCCKITTFPETRKGKRKNLFLRQVPQDMPINHSTSISTAFFVLLLKNTYSPFSLML